MGYACKLSGESKKKYSLDTTQRLYILRSGTTRGTCRKGDLVTFYSNRSATPTPTNAVLLGNASSLWLYQATNTNVSFSLNQTAGEWTGYFINIR